MWISKVRLKNFRSFGPDFTSVEVQRALTGIIGYNSSGKTALLEAFRKVFGVTSAERTLQKSDFHIAKTDDEKNLESIEMVIEFFIEFEDEEDAGVPNFFDEMVVSEPNSEPYGRLRMESTWSRNSLAAEGDISPPVLYYVRSSEDELDETDKIQLPIRKRSLIQTLYVPALRRPSEQMRYASGSLLFRLFQHVNWSEGFDQAFKQKLEETNDLLKSERDYGRIQTKLQESWGKFHRDERYQDADFSAGGPDLDSVLKKLEIRFSPSDVDRPYTIDELGDGYRSLFYLTLVSTLLGLESELDLNELKRPLLTIVLVEEPENHIAPQLLGRVLRNLKNLGDLPNVQVILSSHTPAIVSRIDPEAIRHLRLDVSTHSTLAHRLTLPGKDEEAFTYIKEAVRNYPEIYFARLVVIGEGDSEEVVFKRLMRVFDQDFDDHLIAFAPLGNRFVNHIWRLLNDLHVPFVTLLDLDKGRNGGGWGRVKYALKQLVEIGHKKKILLKLEDGTILSDKAFDGMHKWDENLIDSQNGWISFLEEYDVFFSSPLDLDFSLLSVFKSEYESTIPKDGGPEIPDKVENPTGFQEKLMTGLHATLKSEKATGDTYSVEEKELMIWYNYYFLGRGKPSTHMQALSSISDRRLKRKLPSTLTSFFERIKTLLETN